MAKLKIYTFPDEVLFKVSEPVEAFDDKLKALVDDMVETMLDAPGAGLAAPQVGVSKRLFVVNGEYFDEPDTGFAVINPVLKSSSGKVMGEEGCLSLPGLYGSVRRANEVVIEAQDTDGNMVTHKLKEWPARIFLHEMDHLDGILFPERMRGLAKKTALKQLKRMAEQD